MSETVVNPMAAHVDSLWDSFRQVPPAAVPAMLDCIIASAGLSPSFLFSSLLDVFPNLTKDIILLKGKYVSEQLNNIRSLVVALCHLLKKSGTNLGAMQSFIWKIFIPLMKLVQTPDCEIFNETADSFFDVVTETNTWGIVEATMVPFFLSFVGLSMGMLQSEELAIYGWSRWSVVQGIGDHVIDVDLNESSMMSESGNFPLHVSCHILTSILDSAAQSQYACGNTSNSSLDKAEKFAENLLWDLCNMTVRMLLQSVEHRSCATKFFLPNIFQAFVSHHVFKVSAHGQTHILSRNLFFKKLWACCKTLFSLGSLERRDSYNVLSLYFTSLSCTDGLGDDDAVDREDGFDIRAEKEFWDEMKKGLVDKDGLVRKQSLHILKTVLQVNEGIQCNSGVSETTLSGKSSMAHGLTKRGRWADTEAKQLGVGKICDSLNPSVNSQQKWVAFFLLYEMLEEYGTHLVEAAWNHQITLLLRSFPRDDSRKFLNGALNQNLMEAPEDIFNWLSVLWEMGFLHDNPHVRCLIMESFLGIEWKNYRNCCTLIPEDFVLGPFIQGLNDPVHHKDFGAKGIYSSRTMEGATKFMRQYASDLNLRKRIVFLTNLGSATKKQSFGRAGLMGLAYCIASAACGAQTHCKNEVEWSKDASFNLVQSAKKFWKLPLQ